MYKKGITGYSMIMDYGVPTNTLHRMKHGKDITTKTLNTFCEILNCQVSDVVEYIPDGDLLDDNGNPKEVKKK